MRGEKEQQCLNIIREAIFTNKGQTIYHPFTGKTYQEVSDKEFEEEQIWFTSCECTKNYFGLCKEDRNEIEQILRMAKPNTNLNDFPDFVFNKGFIEHFQITSSQINKKGAVHIRKQSDFQRKVGNEIEKLEKRKRASQKASKKLKGMTFLVKFHPYEKRNKQRGENPGK